MPDAPAPIPARPPERPRRRIIFRRAAVCLALGFAATLATAWGPLCFWTLSDRNTPTIADIDTGTPTWYVQVVNDDNHVIGALCSGLAVDVCDLNLPPMRYVGKRPTVTLSGTPAWRWWSREEAEKATVGADPARYFGEGVFSGITARTCAFGFPRRATTAVEIVTWRHGGMSRRLHGVLSFERLGSREFWLPVRPHWPGLIADIAFWSALFAVPMFAVPAARRSVRRRRGRCVACGYSRAGIDPAAPCPECGGARG